MQVEVTVKSGKEYVYRSMLATQNKKPKAGGYLRDDVWFRMLRAGHSPIEEYELWIDAVVPERVHTHMVRHEEIGKYVATSRPDLAGYTPIEEGMRSLALRINAKRMIEISMQRLCSDAWEETIEFWAEVVERIPDETLKNLCTQPCVKFAQCVGKGCNFMSGLEYSEKRNFFKTGK